MGLTSVLQGAVKTAFSAAGDLKDVVDIHMESGSVYDDNTGDYTKTTVSDDDVKVILYDFESKEVLPTVNFSTDQILMVESRHLVNATTPTHFGIGGIRWDVVSPLKYPGDAMREFHIRNTGQALV